MAITVASLLRLGVWLRRVRKKRSVEIVVLSPIIKLPKKFKNSKYVINPNTINTPYVTPFILFCIISFSIVFSNSIIEFMNSGKPFLVTINIYAIDGTFL